MSDSKIQAAQADMDTVQTRCQKALVDLLIAERKKAGMTQDDLAEAFDQHQSWVSRLESGERRIDVGEFLALALIIGFNAASAIRKIEIESKGDYPFVGNYGGRRRKRKHTTGRRGAR